MTVNAPVAVRNTRRTAPAPNPPKGKKARERKTTAEAKHRRPIEPPSRIRDIVRPANFDAKLNRSVPALQLTKREMGKVGERTMQHDEQNRTVRVGQWAWLSSRARKAEEKKAQRETGRAGGKNYDGGHGAGAQIGGGDRRFNMAPIHRHLNRGFMLQIENAIAERLRKGEKLYVQVDFIYRGDSKKPTEIVYGVYDRKGNRVRLPEVEPKPSVIN